MKKIKLLKLKDKLDFGKYNGKEISKILTDIKYLKWMLSRNKDIKLHKEVIVKIQKNVSLNFDKNFIKLLNSINSEISKKLIKLNNNIVSSSMVDIKSIKSKNDVIKFRYPIKGGKYNEIKIGRFLNKLFKDNNINFSSNDIEDFVNDYKAHHGDSNKNYIMEIVKGDDIRKYYLHDNYFKSGLITTGTLGQSCMRHKECQKFFDIYTNNHKQVSMLIMKDKISGKIKGRAILWTDMKMEYNGVTSNVIFMDRIYYTSYKYCNIFKMYAKNRNWVFKTKQNYQNYTEFQIGTRKFHADMFCKLDNVDFEYYPYLDTIKNFCREEKILSNTYNSRVNRTYYLRFTSGDIDY